MENAGLLVFMHTKLRIREIFDHAFDRIETMHSIGSKPCI